jgi:adenylate cyclase
METWSCVACAGENAEGMRFCGHCGARRLEEWICAACGGENPEGMRFCGHCGAPAAGTAPAAAAAVPEVAAPTPPAPPDEAATADTLRSFVATQVADRLIETGGELPQERRLITALFADVSGFTTLADRLDPEELLEVIDPVVSALSSVVGRYEGYVEKFAGDALLALFGAPVAHEDDAQRALLVALEMHDELARVAAELGPEASGLTLHVGVNSGHGIARILGSEARMDYAVLGDSVILAQRLESAAPPRETYVSELTYRLTRDDFEFEPVGELTLKGKLEPVLAWRLLGRRTNPRPARLERSRALIGRDEELAAVSSTFAALQSGEGTVITLTGEPGVGKSRLTAELRAHVEAEGALWLDARCLSYGSGLPYWPYADLLRRVGGIRAEDDRLASARRLSEVIAETAPAALPFFARLLDLPHEGAEIERLEPEAFRRGLHAAIADWLTALARTQPVVLAVEDLHWADTASLALTEELARGCMRTALRLYLTARPEGASAVKRVAEAAEGAATRSLELTPLDERGIGALIAAMLGGDPPRELPALVIERTAGNPFFAEEMVRSLEEAGDLNRDDGVWRIRPGWDAEAVPPTVEGLLSSRIDLLPRRPAQLLQTASVIGRRIPTQLLEAVAGSAVGDPLERIVAGGFLDRVDVNGEPGVAFHHALVQDVAYSRLLRKQRRDLHRRVAEVAEAVYGSGDEVVALLARHLYLAEAGTKAFDYLVRAGARAKRLFANDEAIVHFGRAVEVVRAHDELTDRLPELLLDLADLRELVGDYDDAYELYEDARTATGDLRAWRGLAGTLRKRGKYEDALGIVDSAVATEALKAQDLAPLWLEAGWSLALSGRLGQAIDVLQAGLATTTDPRGTTAAQLLIELARIEAQEGELEGALGHALDARSIFEEHDDVRGLARTMRVLGEVHAKRREPDEAAAALHRGLELAERVGSIEEIGGCLINLGLVEEQREAFAAAIKWDCRAIEEFERIGHGSGRARGYANLAGHLMLAGDYDRAERWSERAIEVSRAIGHPMTIADAIDTIASIHFRRRHFLEAAARAEEAAAQYVEIGSPPYAANSLELAAQAWREAGEDERARIAETRAREVRPPSVA